MIFLYLRFDQVVRCSGWQGKERDRFNRWLQPDQGKLTLTTRLADHGPISPDASTARTRQKNLPVAPSTALDMMKTLNVRAVLVSEGSHPVPWLEPQVQASWVDAGSGQRCLLLKRW